MTTGRIRLLLKGQPWGPWFDYVEEEDVTIRVKPSRMIRLGAWRTNHVFACMECDETWEDGPGMLATVSECPGCGGIYWKWVTWPIR